MITPIPARCSYSKSTPSKLILYHDVSGGHQDVTGLTDGGVAAKWCEVYSRSLSLACCRIWPSVQECFPCLRLLGLFHITQVTIENRVGSLFSAKIHPIFFFEKRYTQLNRWSLSIAASCHGSKVGLGSCKREKLKNKKLFICSEIKKWIFLVILNLSS